MLTKKLDCLKGYSKAILTPNFGEFTRLYQAAFNVEADEKKVKSGDAARELAECIGCTIFQKGYSDVITDGKQSTCVVTC